MFADIGTDHALLPIYLLKSGRIDRAILSDINEGPLASARENAELFGVLERVELVLADGAAALSDKGVTDVAIFGMGGELIADIIERAPFLKNKNIRLILQPMTKQEHLCRYLFESGFSITAESYTKDAGKFYRTLCVQFSGLAQAPDEEFIFCGRSDTPCEEFEAKIGCLTAHLSSRRRALFGKRAAGLDSSDDAHVIEIIEKELKRLGSSCSLGENE